MLVSDALSHLGTKRAVWIDDWFNDTPTQFAELLLNNIEIARTCQFPELAAILEGYQFDPSGTEQSLVQVLADLEPQRLAAIKAAFFDQEVDLKDFATRDLSTAVVERTCELLNIAPSDRWTFEQADEHIPSLVADGDAHVCYIVDLNEAGGSGTRGLDTLQLLWAGGSTGTAFILTHEADVAGEPRREAELRKFLDNNGTSGLGIPLCVIAKERLYAESTDIMEESLRVAIKRAGLRRSVYDVLVRAKGEVAKAYEQAAVGLLSVPPEQLESHVFERGYKEGVSELHVVERALTAHIAQNLRTFFGVDESIHSSARRLRALRNIQLNVPEMPPDPNLRAFRQAEVWESDALINREYAPIACGDVFDTDQQESATSSSSRKFIFLAQPCDISLRPDGRERAQETAFLIPLKKKTVASRGDPKLPYLPFKLADDQWACDFRNAAVVKMSVLDLASFRSDGRVRVDDGHSAPGDLLVAQQNIYGDRTAAATKALQAELSVGDKDAVSLGLQLTFTSGGVFKHIHRGVYEPRSEAKVSGVRTTYPKRITWRLRRCGRVRMPYAAALLNQYMSVMSRQAFDMDYMAPGYGEDEQEGVPSERVADVGEELEMEAVPSHPEINRVARVLQAGLRLSRRMFGR
jgi:hypothetical protein